MSDRSSRRNFLAAGFALPAAGLNGGAGRRIALSAAAANDVPLRYRTLGNTGIKVTEMGFGCMITSDPSVIEKAADLGINFFDTARVYGGGNNERIGSLGRVPWWNFVDWTKQWPSGVPPAEPDGSSAPLDLQLLLAYQWAAQLENALGSKALAAEYESSAARLRTTTRELYFDASRGIMADTPRKHDFSQHSTVLAVLAGVLQGDEARQALERISSDPSLTQCSIYFRYYLHHAMARAGMGDRYLDSLGQWRDMLSRGLSTWAEQADPTRSDCHAWGASPNIELFRTVLGIDSAAPGFRKVLIRPALGNLTRVSGAIPHPMGEIQVALELHGSELHAKVALPEGVTGEFQWRHQTRSLPSGDSEVVFR